MEFVEKHNCYFGGSFNNVTEQEQAHKYSSNHKEQLLHDNVCGCFHCLNIFSPEKITNWLGEKTAVCPYCGIDAVIGESSGSPITKEFLEKMKKYWF
ncbi:MAG: cytoplasmic protein [Ruminococcaceae bacterium]|nr:cytoplasmic protein [Oscillospiraceae bacterium]